MDTALLGYRARKVHRALYKYGRIRGMTLVGKKWTDPVTNTNWDLAYRETFPGVGPLTEEDLALSLAWEPLRTPPGPNWPEADLRRSLEYVASFDTPEPDDVQVARELLEEREELTEDVALAAHQVLREWLGASRAVRSRWVVDVDRFLCLRKGQQEDES